MSVNHTSRNPIRENAVLLDDVPSLALPGAMPVPLDVVIQPKEHFEANAANPYSEDQVTQDPQTPSITRPSDLSAPDFGMIQIHWPAKTQGERNGIEAHILAGSNLSEQAEAYRMAREMQPSSNFQIRVAPLLADSENNILAYIRQELANKNVSPSGAQGYVKLPVREPSLQNLEAIKHFQDDFPNITVTLAVQNTKVLDNSEVAKLNKYIDDPQKVKVIDNQNNKSTMSMLCYMDAAQQRQQEIQVKKELAKELGIPADKIEIRAKEKQDKLPGRTVSLVKDEHAYIKAAPPNREGEVTVIKATAKDLGINDVKELTQGKPVPSKTPGHGH